MSQGDNIMGTLLILHQDEGQSEDSKFLRVKTFSKSLLMGNVPQGRSWQTEWTDCPPKGQKK